MLFLGYSKCSTSQRAKKFLDQLGISYTARDIKDDRPKREELDLWQNISGLPMKKWFNTSGQRYRELGLKDRLPEMSRDEQLNLLSEDGMLVKRPILVGDDFVLVGFQESAWEEQLNGNSTKPQ